MTGGSLEGCRDYDVGYCAKLAPWERIWLLGGSCASPAHGSSGHHMVWEKPSLGILCSLGRFLQGLESCEALVSITPLIFTGLSVAFAFRTGLFNIGAEDQFIGVRWELPWRATH